MDGRVQHALTAERLWRWPKRGPFGKGADGVRIRVISSPTALYEAHLEAENDDIGLETTYSWGINIQELTVARPGLAGQQTTFNLDG